MTDKPKEFREYNSFRKQNLRSKTLSFSDCIENFFHKDELLVTFNLGEEFFFDFSGDRDKKGAVLVKSFESIRSESPNELESYFVGYDTSQLFAYLAFLSEQRFVFSLNRMNMPRCFFMRVRLKDAGNWAQSTEKLTMNLRPYFETAPVEKLFILVEKGKQILGNVDMPTSFLLIELKFFRSNCLDAGRVIAIACDIHLQGVYVMGKKAFDINQAALTPKDLLWDRIRTTIKALANLWSVKRFRTYFQTDAESSDIDDANLDSKLLSEISYYVYHPHSFNQHIIDIIECETLNVSMPSTRNSPAIRVLNLGDAMTFQSVPIKDAMIYVTTPKDSDPIWIRILKYFQAQLLGRAFINLMPVSFFQSQIDLSFRPDIVEASERGVAIGSLSSFSHFASALQMVKDRGEAKKKGKVISIASKPIALQDLCLTSDTEEEEFFNNSEEEQDSFLSQ